MNNESCEMRKLADEEDLTDPGDYCIQFIDSATGKHIYLFCLLPGGGYCALPIGMNVKPDQSPSWYWDGNDDQPTLEPSVWHMPRSGHSTEWHGYIRNGRMETG